MALPLALALTSGGLSILGSLDSNKQARRQYKFQKRLAAINAQIAAEQANRSINQIRARQVQERAALAQQTQEITDRAREALGVSVTQASESGTAGASLAALQDDFVRQELNAQQALLRSQEFRDQQAQVQADQARTGQRASVLNSLPDPLRQQGILGDPRERSRRSVLKLRVGWGQLYLSSRCCPFSPTPLRSRRLHGSAEERACVHPG